LVEKGGIDLCPPRPLAYAGALPTWGGIKRGYAVQLDARLSFKDTLQQAMAAPARVSLHLRSGLTLGGKVAGVEDHYVLLEGLTDRDFYDALVRIDDISALEVRARDS
jgi:hypothetical protein